MVVPYGNLYLDCQLTFNRNFVHLGTVREWDESHVCASFSETACDFVADSSSAAGYDDGLAIETEHLEDAVFKRRVGSSD